MVSNVGKTFFMIVGISWQSWHHKPTASLWLDWTRFVPLLPKYQFFISSYIMGLNSSTHMGLSYATPIRHVHKYMASQDWFAHRQFWAFYQFCSNLLNKPLKKNKLELSFVQVCAPNFKFKWLKRFQLRCRSVNCRGTLGYG